MKVLVTGGAGFIGSNLIKRLHREGYRVVSLDNYSTGLYSNHVDGVKYIAGDVNIILNLKNEYDIIFHLAAQPRIQPSFKDPQVSFNTNTAGTQNICEFATRNNSKVVYSGSSSRWHNPFQSPYALYKHLGEEICKLYKHTFKLDVEIARFYNVYGPGEIIDGDYAAVIGVWRRQIRDGLPLTIVGDGEQRRDFTHIDDIVDGLLKIGFGDQSHDDAWELGTGLNYSIKEVYLMFKERFGVDYISIPDQPGNYRKTLRENDDSLEKLNWNPADRLKEYIFSL